MHYAIIVWASESSWLLNEPGIVYGWYEQIGTATVTASHIRQHGEYALAVVVKIL